MRSVLIAIVFVAPVIADEAPTKEQIARWIADLGEDRFATREEASKRLWQAGAAAESAVLAATKSPDPEVARRARVLMDKFKWGIYPDTPPKIVDLIQRYRGAEDNGKQAVIKELSQWGAIGCAVLLKIAAAEDNIARPRIFHQIALDTAHAVPDLLVEGKLETLERLLEISIAAEHESAIPSYAACCLMQGKLDERIGVYQGRAEKADDRCAAEVRAYLYRAKGDLAAARSAAAKAGRKDLEEAILYEAGDWKTLAQLDLSEAHPRPIEALGFRAAYQRLAADAPALGETLKQIRAFSQSSSEREWDAWLAAKALFLNDRPQEALALLSVKKSAAAFDVLCAQLRFREALALVDKARTENAAGLPMLEILQARTLHQLGRKAEAGRLFAELGSRINAGQDASWPERLVEVEYRIGLKEQAFEHCARLLESTKNQARQSLLLGKVFPGKGDAAAQWWRFLRQESEEPLTQTMQRLRDVLEGKARGKALDDLVGTAKVLHPDPATAKWMLCIFEVYLNAGMEARANEFLEAAASALSAPEPQLRLGDYLVDHKKWEQAAARYGKAWELDRTQALPLYLKGWALAQAGQAQEGKRLMDLAHWLPLGNERARFAFITELVKRHHRDAVRRESELLLRVGVPGSFYTGEGFRQLAMDAFHRKEHLTAAAYHERAMLRCLRPQTSFQETTAYLGVPHFVHRHRAKGLLDAGRIDEALKEADLCLAALPGNTDLQTLLVPDLEKRGLKQDAIALFVRGYEPHAKLCQDYPDSAWAHNSLAWLCASTRRDLDTALEHARKAVALEPTHPGYHDTLAETYFQRGDRDKAIDEINRSISLDGKRLYFKKQLKRFEAGDPRAELPSPTDEE